MAPDERPLTEADVRRIFLEEIAAWEEGLARRVDELTQDADR